MIAKRLALPLALFLLAGSLGAVIAAPARAQDLSGAQGGDLRVALQGFGGLDPRTASGADWKVLQLVYDSLGRMDPVSLELVPWAATGWVPDAANKMITVTLRDDLTFSDGTAYNANDVAYSLTRYQRGGAQRWQVSAVDATTIRFDFTAIDPGTYDYRTTNPAGPGLFFSEGLTASIAWDRTGTQKYSGPFGVESSTSGQLVLEANVHHFAGRPNLDTVTYLWPYTTELNPNGTSKDNDGGCALMFRDVHFIGWPLLANGLSDLRDCLAGFGGFGPDDPNTIGVNESLRALLNPDPRQNIPFVNTAKNPGPELLYFGFASNSVSMFVGAPGSAGQKLRSAVYLFVNKGLYRDVEPNTAITHGVVNRLDAPWAPASCPPWTPCPLIVDAGTVPAPSPVTRRTYTEPAMIALDNAGFLDRTGDGIRENATGAPVVIDLLAPSFTLDPRKTTIANDMTFLMRTAGLDVAVRAYDTWAALDADIAACTGSCMYVKRFTQATPLPDWLYSMPEVLAAGDPEVDYHLNLGAASSYDHATRSTHVGHVSHLIGEAADFLPVLAYDVLEAYDFETFSGWVNTFGGINNFWTFMDVRRPALGSLEASVSIFPTTSLTPGEETTVQVQVRDLFGVAIGGAVVSLSAPVGTLTPATTVTDGRGIAEAVYTAPATTAVEDVTITATVTKVQYAGTVVWAGLTIHPGPDELSVSVSRGTAPEVDSGTTVAVTIQVRDAATLQAVAGASVVLRTNLPGATITPSSGTTTAAGVFTASFTGTVKQGLTYQIIAEVSKAGYADASESASLAVRSELGEVPVVQTTRNVPGFEAAAAVGAVALAFALVALARRRRED